MIKKLFTLFNKQEKKLGFFLVSLIVVSMLFELFGIALIIPIISLLFDNEYLNSSSLIINLKKYLTDFNIDILTFFLCFMLIIFVIKSILQVYVTFMQKKIVSKLNMNVSNRLFKDYLTQDFLYYSHQNRSRIIHNLQTEMLHFFLFFESFLGLLADSIITSGMYLFVLYIEPTGTIILTFAYLIASLFYFLLFNNRLI